MAMTPTPKPSEASLRTNLHEAREELWKYLQSEGGDPSFTLDVIDSTLKALDRRARLVDALRAECELGVKLTAMIPEKGAWLNYTAARAARLQLEKEMEE
jgi:hypothetical protein